MSLEYSSSVRSVKERVLGKITVLQDAAVAIGNGTAVRPVGAKGCLIVSGITTATIKVEVSHDDITYEQLGADITADGATTIDTPAIYLRARISAWTSGTISARYIE